MSTLRQHLVDYLALRRSLGYKLVTQERDLRSFVAFAEQAGADTITTEFALDWARQPAWTQPIRWARKLSTARGFARYLQTLDPTTAVPPANVLRIPHYQRPTPYLYSEADIRRLMAAARALVPPLRAATTTTLIGLLVVTGMRISEVTRLDRDDVDLAGGLLTVHASKFGKSRLIVCQPSTVQALRAYSRLRDELCPPSATPSFFVWPHGRRANPQTTRLMFRKLCDRAGLRPQSPGGRPPRLHDFRHSLVVATILDWYRDGMDVEPRMPALSSYLGHCNPANTYWYYSDSWVIPMPAPSCA